MDITKSTATVVDHIEREIARLKAARPRLSTRVERAEHIIVTQLSTANGAHKPVKVRVHADGSRSFTVRSCSKLAKGASRKVYTVEAGTFRCDCPDSRRRHSACKHGIAAYILERALRRPSVSTGVDTPGSGCAGCSASGVELFEVVDSLAFFAGDLVCRGCADITASEVA